MFTYSKKTTVLINSTKLINSIDKQSDKHGQDDKECYSKQHTNVSSNYGWRRLGAGN